MIKFINLISDYPYTLFKIKYEEALKAGQKNIEAVAIASYCKKKDQVDSRFVNLKFVRNDKFIFFTNYNSIKALNFIDHDQISALFYWSSTNTQIRIKAKIEKTSIKFNNAYFKKRSIEKNALAISSDQSKAISSYKDVVNKYKKIKDNNDLTICPPYWGGYQFIPYEIEFWKGNDSRLNLRDMYLKKDNAWEHIILEP